MAPDRIAEILVPFLGEVNLSGSQLAQIATYADLLMKWNSHINLTAVRDPEEIIARHFGESLFAAKSLFPVIAGDQSEDRRADQRTDERADQRTDQSVIDVGSGAGFPGVPLKIWLPALKLTLIEANQKKAVFLREVSRALDLSSVTVFAGRAENLSQEANLVVLRAVERFELTIAVARTLVASAGRLALLVGETQIATAQSILPDLAWDQPLRLPYSHSRSLLVGHSR